MYHPQDQDQDLDRPQDLDQDQPPDQDQPVEPLEEPPQDHVLVLLDALEEEAESTKPEDTVNIK